MNCTSIKRKIPNIGGKKKDVSQPAVISRLDWGKMLPNSLMRLLTALCSPFWRLAMSFCQVGLSTTLLTAVQASIRASERSRAGETRCARQKLPFFLKPNLRRDIPLLCHILFVRSKAVSPACAQGKGITREDESWEARITGASWRLPTPGEKYQRSI